MECELLEARQQGREIFYQIKIERMDEVNLWIDQIRKIWDDRFDNLGKYLEKIQD